MVRKSAMLYQERQLPEDRITRRQPMARSNLQKNLAHTIKVDKTVSQQEKLQQPPDSAASGVYPDE